MNTGDVIKYLRKRNKMTQKELADLLGVKKSSVQKYECGRVQNLKLETIQKLCHIFNAAPIAFIFPEMWKEIYPQEENAISLDERIPHYLKLTKEGREKVLEYIKDMSEIERYCTKTEGNEGLKYLLPELQKKGRSF